MNSSPTTQTEPKPPVTFMLAGAQMELSEEGITGAFHPIPAELWDAIIGFHRQVSINHDAESVSYHRWHAPTGEYHSLIPFQETKEHGLSIDFDWTSPENAALLDEYAEKWKEDFFPACSIHTHVDASAFESGTDAKDENEQPGWHITLGHLLSHDEYHFDFRMRLPKMKKVTDLVNTSCSYELSWKNLFLPSIDEKLLYSTPGSAVWHKHLHRVKAI